MLKRTAEIGGSQGVVDDQWDVHLFTECAELFKVEDIQSWIADGFGKNAAGFRTEGFLHLFNGALRVDKADLDTQLGQGVGKEREGSTVQGARRDHMLTAATDVEDRECRSGLAG